MMAIRDAARDAWLAAQSGVETQLRAKLAEVLTPFDVSQLVTVDLLVTDGASLLVVCDEADDVCLAVSGDVHLVSGEPGHWSSVSRAVFSLADLYRLLPPLPAPTYPEWIQPTGALDAYAAGVRVLHNGKVWESLVDANVWEPGVSGWREVV